MHTLVLNADYTPLNLVPIRVYRWNKAIEQVYKGKAKVIHEYDDWVVRSPSITLKVPSVIIRKEYQKPPRFVRFSRENLFLRDRYTCQYCGTDKNHLTFDHVKPVSHGGGLSWENIVAACSPCNSKRGNNDKIRPAYEPYKPDYWEMVEKRKKLPIIIPHESWIPYLDWDRELIRIVPKKH